MKLSKQTAIASIVFLVVGFLFGMEYKAYQVRSAIYDGLEEVNEVFTTETDFFDEGLAEEQVRVNKQIGEVVEFATISLKVNSIEETDTISTEYGQPTVAAKNARFLVLDVDITNITKKPFTHWDNGLILIDEQDREFDAYDSLFAIDNQLAARELAPNITENGKIVYQIPEDAKEYYLVSGKAGTNEAYYIKLNKSQVQPE